MAPYFFGFSLYGSCSPFPFPYYPLLSWGFNVWHSAIQPRKSLTTWKVLHGRLLVDAALQRRGESLCSCCHLCGAAVESISHLFFECPRVQVIWKWLFGLFQVPMPHSSSAQLLLSPSFICHLPVALKILWRMTVCNFIWCIWTERNKLRFEDSCFCPLRFKQFFFLSFKDSASLYFSPSSASYGVPPVFLLLGLSPLRFRANSYIPVVWTPPPVGWLKVNTDGSFRDSSRAGFGGVFRNHEGFFVGGFSSKVVVGALLTRRSLQCLRRFKLLGFVVGLMSGLKRTLHLLSIITITHPHLIPWRLRMHWKICLHLASLLHFRISHIFREGNYVADGLANYGAKNEGSVWWISLPSFLATSFGRDLCSRPAYRLA
ncbi:hypothetical protein M0R45_004967 [Rubus argutus]|uniref:Reverse transcriptase zinc-binding domain-containing protein n=1 Tax=Rubus argutus TaxID=59490 RepID=A0AAW1YLA1_RUBAR